MIFTLEEPDSFILPNNEDKNCQELTNKIVSVKISHCQSYIFILSQKCLFVYNKDNDFVCLERFMLAELGNYECFRDIIILPTPNLIALLVDNLKHLLIVNCNSVSDSTTKGEEEVGNKIKNPPKLKFIYDIVVPKDFSFFYTIKNQFYFWLHKQSGFYRTIYKKGFLNHLVDNVGPNNHQVINLYLLTTNVLNINIIGNVNFLYSLCYIHLKLNVVDNNLIYKGTTYKISGHTLDGIITKCVDNINNISGENDFEGPEERKPKDSAPVENEPETIFSKDASDNLSLEIQEVRNIYHTNDDQLYILTTSNQLLCLIVNEKEEENLVGKDTEVEPGGDKGVVMGKIMCKNLKQMCINEKHMIFCIVFKDNEVHTVYKDKVISNLKFDAEVKSIKWLDYYLFILTSKSIHVCTYYLHFLYQININGKVSEVLPEYNFKKDPVLELSKNSFMDNEFDKNKRLEPSEADGSASLHSADECFRDSEEKETEAVDDIVVIDNKIMLFRDQELLVYDIVNLRSNEKYNVFYTNHTVYVAANHRMSSIYKKSTRSITTMKSKNFIYNIKLNNISQINDIKINNICSYMLIQYNGNNVLLYSKNRTAMVKNDDSRVVNLNFFTNYIYYIVLETGEEYNISFYNINSKLIEIKTKSAPVKMIHEDPYLFIVLLSNNVIQTYDLYYINYKLVNTIDINKLKPTILDFTHVPDKIEALDEVEHAFIDKNWIDFHKLTPYEPEKDFDDVYIIMNIYRDVYIINNKYIKYLLTNVNQIVHIKDCRYLLTVTNDANTVTVTEEQSEPYSGNITPFSNHTESKLPENTDKSINAGTAYIVDKTGKLIEVTLNEPNNYILSISDNNQINLMKVSDGIFLYNDVLLYNISSVVNYEKLLLMHLLNNKHRSEILSTNLLSRAAAPPDHESSGAYAHFKKLYYKLFSVLYRKMNNIEDIKGLDKVVKRFSEECSLGLLGDRESVVDEIFNNLLELKEYNFCSLLLLTLQLKTDPVHTRKKYCKVLIQKLVHEITQVILNGLNNNRFNFNLLNNIIAFYNRIYEDPAREGVSNNVDGPEKDECSVRETELESLSIECLDNGILVNELVMLTESNPDFSANVLLYNIIKLNHAQII